MNNTFRLVSIAGLFTVNNFALAKDYHHSYIDEIQVTASRVLEDTFDTHAALTIFDREDIEQTQARSLSELLQRVAGFSVLTQGTVANSSSVFVRGGNSDHVLILVDGVRVGSATLGIKAVEDLSIQNIERIEIVRGPRASLWGSDAIGAVIQLFTRKLDPSEGQLRMDLGSNGLKGLSAALGVGDERSRGTLAINSSEAQGFDVLIPAKNDPFAPDQPDRDGFRRQSVSLNLTRQWSEDMSTDLIGQFDRGNTEFDASFGGDEVNFENHFINLRSSLQFEESWNLTLTMANAKDKNFDNADKLFEGTPASFYQTERFQFNAVVSHDFSDSTNWVFGIDWNHEEVQSTTLYQDNERDLSAGFVLGRTQWDKWAIEGSLRYDSIAELDAEMSHQASIAYQLSANDLLSLSHAKAFKVPTFNDLYWPMGFGSQGNPLLRSEQAYSTELLYRHQSRTFDLQMSLFDTDYTDLIEWAYVEATAMFTPQNVTSASARGVELTLNWQVSDLNQYLALTYLDAINEQTQQRLLRRPEFQAFYTIDYAFNSWGLVFEVNYQSDRQEVNAEELSTRTLFNVGSFLEVSDKSRVNFRINNLSDKDYQQAFSYPAPGREFLLTWVRNF